jgi:secondary thiamine-phosphate synthase enzyme
MIITRKISADTHALDSELYVEVINITPQVQKQAQEIYITNGIVNIFVPATTAAITTIEFEAGLMTDFRRMWSRIVPMESIAYEHKFLWEANNAYSHIRASLLGPSLVVPLVGKRLTLGQYQQIVLVEFDNRPRSRQVILQFMGEAAE